MEDDASTGQLWTLFLAAFEKEEDDGDGDDGEGVVRDVHVDALEVVGAGSADGDLVQVLLGLLSTHGQTSIFRH